MNWGLLLVPAVLLAAILGFGYFLLRRLNYFSRYSYALYAVLAAVWIVNGFATEMRLITAPPWALVIALGLAGLIPGLIRVPLAYLARRLRSRKIPLLITNLVFLTLCVPFFVNPSPLTWLVLVAGYSFPGATFGASNNYLSETWTPRHLYTTYALISILPLIGFLTARFGHGLVTQIAVSSAAFDTATLRWVLLALVITLSMMLFGYARYFPLRTRKLIDNKSVVNRAVSNLGFGALMRLMAPGVILALLSGHFLAPALSGGTGASEATLSLMSLGVIVVAVSAALFTSLVLIHYVPLRVILLAGQTGLALALAWLTLGAFVFPYAPGLLTAGGLVAVAFLGSVEAAYFGYAVHIDTKSRFLLISSYLSLRSLLGGASDVSITTLTLRASSDKLGAWLALSALVISLLALGTYVAIRRWRKPVEQMVDLYEQKFYAITRQFLWKNRAR